MGLLNDPNLLHAGPLPGMDHMRTEPLPEGCLCKQLPACVELLVSLSMYTAASQRWVPLL